MNKPKLSLCMIIRNEEQMLPGFLTAAEGLWDELCVVDTGSTDASLELLHQAGAILRQIPWANDFSAARNASLDMATGEWVIFLDADEIVSPELKQQIRDLLADVKTGAATLVVRNQFAQGHRQETHLLRLFRNNPSIRFRFPIHEDVVTSVKSYLRSSGKQLIRLSGAVEHLGYMPQVMAEKDKKRRDQVLLERCLAQNSADFYSWFKLLELACFWDDRLLWEDIAKRAKERLAKAGSGALQGFDYVGELIALIAEGAFKDDLAGKLDFLQAYEQPSSAAYLLKRAETYELLGQMKAARRDFSGCLRLGEERLAQLVTVRPRLGLARLAMAAGKLQEAIEHVDASLADSPRDLEALLAAVALQRIVSPDALAAFIQKHQHRYGDSCELRQAIGEEAFLFGDFACAARALAAADLEDNHVKLKLAQALLAQGKIDEALEQCSQMLTRFPEAAAGVIVCTLLKGEDINLDVEIELEQLDLAMRSWVQLLQRAPQKELLPEFLQMSPAITHLFPWLAFSP